MKQNIIFGMTLAVAMWSGASPPAASDSATARARVLSVLSLDNETDLNFGDAYRGDIAATVAPTETAKAARFALTNGTANVGLQISYDMPEPMLHEAGTPGVEDDEIVVDNFSSNIDLAPTTGSQTFHVGARRAAIRANQALGNYTGTFTVTVNYAL